MRRSGQTGQVDANQPAIVQILRDLRCSVLSLAPLGQDAPDLLVGVAGFNLLWEVKDGAKAPSARALTKGQRTFHENWHGKIQVVESIDQAIDLVEFARGRLRRPQ